MKIVGFLLKYVVINLVLMVLFVIAGISFMTKQFPPKISTIKDYTSKVINFSDTYKSMVSASNTAIQKQLGSEMGFSEADLEGDTNRRFKIHNEAGAGGSIQTVSQSDEVRTLNHKIQNLSAEINRLQNENHELRTRLMSK